MPPTPVLVGERRPPGRTGPALDGPSEALVERLARLPAGTLGGWFAIASLMPDGEGWDWRAARETARRIAKRVDVPLVLLGRRVADAFGAPRSVRWSSWTDVVGGSRALVLPHPDGRVWDDRRERRRAAERLRALMRDGAPRRPGRPRRDKPGRRIVATVDADLAERLSRTAEAAGVRPGEVVSRALREAL